MFTQIKWILGFIFFFLVETFDLFPGGFIFLILISKNKQLSDITKDSVCVVLKNQLNKPGLCTKRRGTKWTDGLETLTTMWNRKFRPVPDSFLRCHMSAGIEAVSGRIWVRVETQLTSHLQFDERSILQTQRTSARGLIVLLPPLMLSMDMTTL